MAIETDPVGNGLVVAYLPLEFRLTSEDTAQCVGAGGSGHQGSVGRSRRKVANERVVQGKT